MSIKHKLVDEFNSELEALNTMEVGGDDYKVAVDGVTKIADRIIELERLESENQIRTNAQYNEIVTKMDQLKADKRDRLIKNCITGFNVVGGLGFAAWAFVASMKYEDKGLIPSTEGGRMSLKHLLRFKF